MTIARALMQQTSAQYGSQSYTTPGTYSWIAPSGIYSISAVAIGAGGGGGYGGGNQGYSAGGNGGGLGYINNFAVQPGKSYTVVVGAGGAGVFAAGSAATGGTGGNSYFNSITTVMGVGGSGGVGVYGCTPTCGGGGGGSCFLAGSLVVMADKSLRRIEDVKVGEYLMGAFGEANRVIAKDDPIIGDRYMYKIDDEHYTCDDHPHVTPDKKFYSCDVDAICNVWGEFFPCELGDGSIVMLKNYGLDNPREKIMRLVEGVELLHIDGPKKVTSVKKEVFDYNTRLYNFVLGGSHTYYVDGYCVTAWPREDDFDYLTWTKKDKILTLKDYQ